MNTWPELQIGDCLITASGRKVRLTPAGKRDIERAIRRNDRHEERYYRLCYLDSGIRGNGVWCREDLQAAGFRLA